MVINEITKDTERCEGVYAQWIKGGDGITSLLQIERVNGDCSVTRMFITEEEYQSLTQQLR